jgi:membrane fusion protein, copper/silver efflux system
MKKNLRNKIFLLLALLLPLALPACRENHPEHTGNATTYTCPMHPQIVRTEPGSCPICGMDLVPRRVEEAKATTHSNNLDYLLRPTNQTVISDIKTTKPVTKAVEQELTLTGVISYDTRRQYTIPARFGGRIEKLYVQFNFQPVRKGQKLFEIYSPELVTAQKELVYLLQHDTGNTELVQGAKQKLRYLGLTDSQINQIVRTRQANYTVAVYSPYNGYVTDPTITTAPTYNAATTANAGGSSMGSMGSGMAGNTGNGNQGTANTTTQPAQGFSIREGMYVNTGQTLFRVINAEEVWAEFNVSSTEAANLKKGTPITISYNQLPAKTINTRVQLVQPFYNAGESFAKVRALVPAQNKATQVGQLITGKVALTTGSSLWIPKSAVVELGTTSVVFRKAEGAFQPIGITTGQRTDELVEVTNGLDAQTEIANNAQFLVDSESFIRVAENR